MTGIRPYDLIWPSHLTQLGVYFLLIEAELRIRPTHRFIVLGDGTRHIIENSDEMRAWVLDLAAQIRAARANVSQPIPVNPKPGQCPVACEGIAGRFDCSRLGFSGFAQFLERVIWRHGKETHTDRTGSG